MKLASRSLARSPGFTIVAVLITALGIGATTAIFSAIHAILLRPLPVPQPEQLVAVSAPLWYPGFSEPVSHRVFEQFRTQAKAFSGLCVAGWSEPRPFVAPGADAADRFTLASVSGNFFSTLAVGISLGRAIGEADDRRGAPGVAVISDAFWRRRFAGDPAIIGQMAQIEKVPVTIIGVAAPGFSGVVVGESVDAWIPVSLQPQLDPEKGPPGEDEWIGPVLGRLRPGISPAQARAELEPIFQQDLARRAAGVNLQNPELRRRFVGRTFDLVPAATGFRDNRSLGWRFRGPIGVLAAAAGAVLLIACANVAGLLLVRSAARQREFAVRAALGASRGQLAGQLLAESLLFAAAGGLLGLGVAAAGTRLLVRYLPADSAGFAATDLGLNPPVLGFALLLTIAVGLVCGLAPALRLHRANLAGALKDQAGTIAGAARPRFNQLLVVLQVALSCALLSAAAILGRSLHNLRAFDGGFARDHLLTFTLEAGKDYAGARGQPLYHRVLERLQVLPGVKGATFSAQMPLVSSGAGTRFKVPGYTPGPNEVPTANFLEIGPRFFATLGFTPPRGRDFNAGDLAAGAPPVAIVGETMARHFWPGLDPVGRFFTWGRQTVQIVGVAPDMKSYDWVREPARFTFYRPYTALLDDLHHMGFQIRTGGDPHGLAPAIRALVREIEPRAQVLELRTMAEAVEATLRNERAVAQISSFFGLFAVTLAALGLYGLLSFGVVRRTREIGVRVALGAQAGDILRLILGQGLGLAVVGCALGLASVLATTRLIGSLLYGIEPADPFTLGLSALALLAIAAFACWIPARRAARLDPIVALRTE